MQEMVARNYPSRDEMNRRFEKNDHEWKKKASTRVALIVAGILVTAVLSFVGTVATVSTCFLRVNVPSACGALPGFNETQKRNERIIKEFMRLGEITERNDRRLTRLEQGQ